MLFASFACAFSVQADETAVAAPEKSLYERLGGQAAISAVVDDFVPRAAANPAVNFTRQGQPRTWEATPENVDKLKKHLVQFVSVATGAKDVTYEGRDMVTAHEGLKITGAEFDALAADLAASCDKLGVPAKEKEELLAVAGSTRGSIVQA
jgi:hemoglobin